MKTIPIQKTKVHVVLLRANVGSLITTINNDSTTQRQVIFEPMFTHNNPLNMDSYLYRVFRNVEKKIPMTYIGGTKIVMGAPQRCNKKYISGSTGRQGELNVCDWATYLKQCIDEFLPCMEDYISGELKGLRFWSDNQKARAFWFAFTSWIRNSLQNNIYQSIWFGDTNLELKDWKHCPNLTDKENQRLFFMLSRCKGIWQDLLEHGRIFLDIPKGELPEEYAITLFEKMWKKRSLLLKTFPKNQICFVVSESVFDNYIDCLKDPKGQISETYNLFINGTPIDGVYKWCGVNVIRKSDWDFFDMAYMCQEEDDQYHRAILTAHNNFGVGTNIRSTVPQMEIWQGSREALNHEWMYSESEFKIGGGLVNPELSVAARTGANSDSKKLIAL